MGKNQVIDADISKYFDTIPHDKLLALVAKRIVDKHILRLIKRWLKAPVVEEGEDGKSRTIGNQKGTPQGGVISPLLANIYLNVLDKLWKVRKVEERMEARLIRYADDLVVMCRGNAEKILKGTGAILGKLGLSLNEEKARVVNTWRDRFDFLGFTVEMAKSPRTGKMFPLIRPSKRAMAQIQAEIKVLTCRRMLRLPKEVIIQKLNEAVRGWAGYFYYGNCSQNLSMVKRFLEERVRIYLRRKQAKKNRGYRQYPNQHLYTNLHLYKIPTTAPWTQTAKASGRR
jgi:group II intron reverse transcriptase/maturase